MKTEFTRNNKDNIATATVLAVGLFAVASGLFASELAIAKSASATPMATQTMETIVVTAPRIAHTTLKTIVVTASRNTSHA